ncbi:magnesium/cobalt efflux protein, partial [Treponema pallidum]
MGVIDWLRRRHAVTHIFQQPLNEEKQDMIRGIVDLSDTSVREVMIPRIDVDF